MKYKITTKDKKIILNEPTDVYAFVIESIYMQNMVTSDEDAHISASDAQCWCELANAGDEYITDDFKIECVYNF